MTRASSISVAEGQPAGLSWTARALPAEFTVPLKCAGLAEAACSEEKGSSGLLFLQKSPSLGLGLARGVGQGSLENF